MERSMLEIIMDAQRGGGESIFASMKFAVLPIAKVFTMCFLGFLMASKHVNILPANGRKLLNGASFYFILYHVTKFILLAFVCKSLKASSCMCFFFFY